MSLQDAYHMATKAVYVLHEESDEAPGATTMRPGLYSSGFSTVWCGS